MLIGLLRSYYELTWLIRYLVVRCVVSIEEEAYLSCLLQHLQKRTQIVLILRDRNNFIILSRIKIKTIIKFPQIIFVF